MRKKVVAGNWKMNNDLIMSNDLIKEIKLKLNKENDADIYIGFLWVIDLGVGLVFFIFILHFTSFLFQKSQFNLTARHFIFAYLLLFFIATFIYYNASSADVSYYGDLEKT